MGPGRCSLWLFLVICLAALLAIPICSPAQTIHPSGPSLQATPHPGRATTLSYTFSHTLKPGHYDNVTMPVGDNAKEVSAWITDSSGDIDLYLNPWSQFEAVTIGELEDHASNISDGMGWEESIIITAPPYSCLYPIGSWYFAVLNLNGYDTAYTINFTVTYHDDGPTPAGDFKLYYPHVGSTGPWGTELCVINPESQGVSATFQFYSDAGELTYSRSLDLASGERLVVNVLQDWGQAVSGYAVLQSDSPNLVGYTKFFVWGQYGVAVPAVPEDEINQGPVLVSHIASTDQWWTGLSLVNTTASPKTVTLSFNDGQIRTRILPAHGHEAFSIAQIFGGVSQPSIISGVITGAEGVIGLELFAGPHQISGVLLKDQTTTDLCFPYIFDDNEWTGFVGYNPSPDLATLTVSPYGTDGTSFTPISASIGGWSQYIGTAQMLGIPPEAKWFRVASDRPLTGFLLNGSADMWRLSGYTVTGNLSFTGIFPCIEAGEDTAVYLVNPNRISTTVQLIAYDDSGGEVATAEVYLPANGLMAGQPWTFFQADIGRATYLAYAALSPVSGFQRSTAPDRTMQNALPSSFIPALPGTEYTVGQGDTYLAIDAPDGSALAEFHGTQAIIDYTVVGATGQEDMQVVLNGQGLATATTIGALALTVDYAPDGSGAYTLSNGAAVVGSGTVPAMQTRSYTEWVLGNLGDSELVLTNLAKNHVSIDLNPTHPFVDHLLHDPEIHALAAAKAQELMARFLLASLGARCGQDKDCTTAFTSAIQAVNNHLTLVDIVLGDLIEDAWEDFTQLTPAGDVLVYKTLDAGGTRALWVHDLTTGEKWMVPGTLGLNLHIVGLSQTGVLVLFDRAGAFTGESDRVLVSTNWGRNTPVDLTPSFNLYSSSKLYPREVDVDALGRVYFCGHVKDSREGIYRINADGTGLMVLPIDANDDGAYRDFVSPFVSVTPDGSMLTFSHGWGGGWLTMASVSGSLWNIRLVNSQVQDGLISPHGKYVVFDSDYYGDHQLSLVQAPDGALIALNRPNLYHEAAAFSPDEAFLALAGPSAALPELTAPWKFRLSDRQYLSPYYSINDLDVAGMESRLGFAWDGDIYFSGGNYEVSPRADIYRWRQRGSSTVTRLTHTDNLHEYDLEVMKRTY